MKISPSSLKTPLAETSAAERSTSSSRAHQAYNSGSTNEVDFSAAARQLNSLQDSSADVDMQKVQALREAIAAGELKIDTSRIADSLIASVRDLLK
ncbi:flagellar biosynthesis anti-sigma factor FlgM [Alcaligenes aquatilis]|uniref:Negative regulator of flagellin synthesis n=1 Tax=Alcaligenes aquatilis TaxID=323284 RepID=A0A3G2HT87_9BURK|nr:flagellar biosynthesis anti-sigma factor FlgM [Alcaligenes aquatilis]AYN20356.1 flagellar biosynthesis anti-sigma factor FlgM [Alcaligenes aquatilis]